MLGEKALLPLKAPEEIINHGLSCRFSLKVRTVVNRRLRQVCIDKLQTIEKPDGQIL